MKTIKFLALFVLSLIYMNSYSQAVVPAGWGCSYGDVMLPAPDSKDGSMNEYDVYITFIKCIDNKFTEKGGDYTSIPSSLYMDVWVCNRVVNKFKPNQFDLNGNILIKEFENENRMHFYLQNPLNNTAVMDMHDLHLGISHPYGDTHYGYHVEFTEMQFPEYYIIPEAPYSISAKSEQDFSVKVANAKPIPTSGFTLATPDAVSLYFYTAKDGKVNAFKTPVNPIPVAGADWFEFIYPGKNVKADYDAGYFSLGEGAVVVKSAKSYPIQITWKQVDAELRCLVTTVVKAEKTYEYIP